MQPPSLERCDVDAVPRFSFAGRTLRARLLDVYDGDTVTAAFAGDDGALYKMGVRLRGVDTPELRGSGADEKAAAVRARTFVAAWALPGRFAASASAPPSRREIAAALKAAPAIVTLRCDGFDKYGRCLAAVWRLGDGGGDCLNERLLREGHAREYGGGRRAPWPWPGHSSAEPPKPTPSNAPTPPSMRPPFMTDSSL